LTDDQFNAALEIEIQAEGKERVFQAWGVQAAVADLMGGKGDAMRTYIREMQVDESAGKGGAANAKTEQGRSLARRIKSLVDQGEM